MSKLVSRRILHHPFVFKERWSIQKVDTLNNKTLLSEMLCMSIDSTTLITYWEANLGEDLWIYPFNCFICGDPIFMTDKRISALNYIISKNFFYPSMIDSIVLFSLINVCLERQDRHKKAHICCFTWITIPPATAKTTFTNHKASYKLI